MTHPKPHLLKQMRLALRRKHYALSTDRTCPQSPTHRSALRKLLLLDAAETLQDLRLLPGNRLEKLKGNRAGQHRIRINDPWRICVAWHDGGADSVEIPDCPS
ncbi:MAG: type II toxin-antitoxin system RelE/ParE family toxin [Anaerolineae bacterium]